MRDETREIVGMSLAAGFWIAALWIGAVAHGDELCGPAGCVEVASAGCYVEDGQSECSDKVIHCEEHLTPEQLKQKYGQTVASLCGFERGWEGYVNWLEIREERLLRRVSRLRSRLKAARCG